MKLHDIITVLFESDSNDIDSIITMIKRDCKPFIKANKHHFQNGVMLYRGMRTRQIGVSSEADVTITKYETLTDRTPTDSSRPLHDLLNDRLFKHGSVKWRSSSVFATTDISSAKSYGEVYLFFPIGNYNMLSSSSIVDAWANLESSQYDFITTWKLSKIEPDIPGKCKLWYNQIFGKLPIREILQNVSARLDETIADEKERSELLTHFKNTITLDTRNLEAPSHGLGCPLLDWMIINAKNQICVHGKVTFNIELNLKNTGFSNIHGLGWNATVHVRRLILEFVTPYLREVKIESKLEKIAFAIFDDLFETYSMSKTFTTDGEVMVHCKSYYLVKINADSPNNILSSPDGYKLIGHLS